MKQQLWFWLNRNARKKPQTHVSVLEYLQKISCHILGRDVLLSHCGFLEMDVDQKFHLDNPSLVGG